ncbi:hypothetical protein PMAYCL1PPCAC_02571 [Pristionchus mayeri]|uniref:F-box domain-containing protein n=1 Tax=Pristionchus mayeri TaxID=1317129 RepID=A0AAN5C8K9_9BILA|nr:hypothetical protein PMAYCL1PPCAC_02571 [Pristionchus mayeri]
MELESISPPVSLLPMDVMTAILSYLNTLDLERLRSTCTLMRDYVDASISSLPKKIEQCNFKIEGERCRMRFVIEGGCNDPKEVLPNGFTFSSFIRNGWTYEKDEDPKFHVNITRQVDDSLWDSISEGFSQALFDGFTLEMPLTMENVSGLSGALRSARFDEFRVAISRYEEAEIGKLLSSLIGSRQCANRSFPHLYYALIELRGEAFELAVDFILRLSHKVPSFEVETRTQSNGWEDLLTLDHLVLLQQSPCQYSLEFEM